MKIPTIFNWWILQERRKFGKYGWNVCYDFSDSNFNIGLDIMNTFLANAFARSNGQHISWNSLSQLIGEVKHSNCFVLLFQLPHLDRECILYLFCCCLFMCWRRWHPLDIDVSLKQTASNLETFPFHTLCIFLFIFWKSSMCSECAHTNRPCMQAT